MALSIFERHNMKAKPVRLLSGMYVLCPVEEATHVILNFPGPVGTLSLPVIRSGKREGTHCWSWNGDTEAPTLKPSVLTRGHTYTCHSWINNGQVQFLSDSSHELAGQTVPLLDVE